VNQTYKIIAASVALLLAAYFGHWITNNHWQAKWSKHIEQDAKQVQAANEAVRAQERQWRDKLNEASKDAKLREQQLKIDSDELGATVDGLRQQLALSTSKLQSANSTVTRLRAAGATNAVVRAELCGWAVQRAEELAGIADRNRQKGLACEAAYNALRL
jgi:hypothetical protein